MRAAFLRAARIGASSAAPSGYDLAARITAQKADSMFGAYWSDTSDPFAPNGLQAPTPPNITSSVNVTTLSGLRAAIGNGVQITLTAPGPHTETTRTIFDLPSGIRDCRIILTGATCNITGNYHSYTVPWNSQRCEIIGGTFNAVPQVLSTDFRAYDGTYVGDNNSANPDANGSGTGIYGHRTLFEKCRLYGWNGIDFTGAIQSADIVASCSGTTLDVTTVYEGTLRIGASIIANGGTDFATKTWITAFGTGSGGTGTYTVSVSQTRASARASVFERATNGIFANCDIEVPVSSDGLHVENCSRFNGIQMGLVIDSRLASSRTAGAKPTCRVTCDYTNEFSTKTAGWVNCQMEDQGLQATGGNAGVYPYVENIILDGNRWYRGGSGAATGFSVDAEASFNIVGFSGNGTTVTVTAFAQNRTNLNTGDSVTIQQSGADPGFNGTYTITVTGARTFTIVNSTVGTYGGAQTDYYGFAVCSSKVGNANLMMRNNLDFDAPAEATAGTGIVPTGAGSPNPAWTTCNNSANSLANGNEHRTYVSTPAWSFYTYTPT